MIGLHRRRAGTVTVALVGTRGVPAKYGGFETAIDEIGPRLVGLGIDVVVYCRHAEAPTTAYKGMRLVHLPTVRSKVTDTLVHSFLCAFHLIFRPVDCVILFNAANMPVVPLLWLRRHPVVVHVDGLEWMRSKWGRAGRRYYLVCEALAAGFASEIIADAQGIQKYYRDRYKRQSVMIPYGAKRPALRSPERLAELGVRAHEFHLVVARFEPENHVALVVDGYHRSACKFPLLVVGSAPYSATYTQEIRSLSLGDERVRLLGALWDQDLLDLAFGSCLTYLHGHSVGGTNPALLRAMGAGAPVVAFDVEFNREVAGDLATYFLEAQDVSHQLEEAERLPERTLARGLDGQRRILERYDWDRVARAYADLVEGAARRA